MLRRLPDGILWVGSPILVLAGIGFLLGAFWGNGLHERFSNTVVGVVALGFGGRRLLLLILGVVRSSRRARRGGG